MANGGCLDSISVYGEDDQARTRTINTEGRYVRSQGLPMDVLISREWRESLDIRSKEDNIPSFIWQKNQRRHYTF